MARRTILFLLLVFLCLSLRAYAAESGECSFYLYEANGAGTVSVTRYSGPGGDVAVPAQIDGFRVTVIGRSAFSGCDTLTSVTLPEGVTAVRAGAFSGCGALTAVTFPDSLTVIGSCAFENCVSLTGIILPDGIGTLGSRAFADCSSLAAVTLPSLSSGLSTDAFLGCESIVSVTCPSDFSGCFMLKSGLSDSGFRYSVTMAQTAVIDAPADRKIKSAAIPDRLGGYPVTVIGKSAFIGCTRLVTVQLPATLTAIGENAFSGCAALRKVTLPDGLTVLGDKAFEGCLQLTSVTLPDSLTAIGDNPFQRCQALQTFSVSETHPILEVRDGILFDRVQKRLIACPPAMKLTGYTVPDGTLEIGAGAFTDCLRLTAVTLPDSLVSIGAEAFAYCGNLSYLSLPDRLTSLGDGAFLACGGLTALSVPRGVTSIGKNTFFDCKNLADVLLPDSVAAIGVKAFSGCPALTVRVFSDASPAAVYCKKNNIIFRVVRDSFDDPVSEKWTALRERLSGVFGTARTVDRLSCLLDLFSDDPALRETAERLKTENVDFFITVLWSGQGDAVTIQAWDLSVSDEYASNLCECQYGVDDCGKAMIRWLCAGWDELTRLTGSAKTVIVFPAFDSSVASGAQAAEFADRLPALLANAFSFRIRVPNGANIRTGPGSEYPKAACASDGSVYDTLGQASAGDGCVWYRIRVDGTEGFISSGMTQRID